MSFVEAYGEGVDWILPVLSVARLLQKLSLIFQV